MFLIFILCNKIIILGQYLRIMNQEQKDYISLLNSSSVNDILIKKTGWEEISLHAHMHEKYQIIYTLSGTLHIQIEDDSYFVPEKHIAWIPDNVVHEINSNNRQVSLVIFYFSPVWQPENIRTSSFCIYNTNSVIGENIKYLASCGDCIKGDEKRVLFDFAISFFNLLPALSYKVDFLLKTMSIPNDHRLYPILCYMREHAFRNLKIEQVAAEFNVSVRNLSRLLHNSGIRFNTFINRHRVNRAIELFSDGGMTMQQIAYETGFSTPNNFNRVFKQITGTSPGLYEKGVEENKKQP